MTTVPGAVKHYDLVASLGAGGMANVYLAFATGPEGFRKLVVVKKLHTTLADDPEFLGMFRQEARLAARLNHPNIVQTLDFGVEDDRYVIVMEYLEGQSLHAIQKKAGAGQLPLANHLSILLQVLSALEYAHSLTDFDGTPLRIIHRDVSPHNVFVTYAGQTKLVDFGIAKALAQSSETTHGGTKGKVAYMAPEQERGDPLDARTDLFAVGVMLWEALVGHPLWIGLSDLAIISRLHFAEIPTPREANADVNPELEEVCLRALAHRPSDRFSDAAEFRHALERCIDGLGLRARPEETGKLVADLFAEDRHRLARLVGEHLSSRPPPLSAAAPPGSVPPIAESTGPKPPATHRPAPAEPHPRRRAWAVPALLAAAAGASIVFASGVFDAGRRPGAPIASSSVPPLPSQSAAVRSEPVEPVIASTVPTAASESTGEVGRTNAPAPVTRTRTPVRGGAQPDSGASEYDVVPAATANAAPSVNPPPSPDAGVVFDDPWSP